MPSSFGVVLRHSAKASLTGMSDTASKSVAQGARICALSIDYAIRTAKPTRRANTSVT